MGKWSNMGGNGGKWGEMEERGGVKWGEMEENGGKWGIINRSRWKMEEQLPEWQKDWEGTGGKREKMG